MCVNIVLVNREQVNSLIGSAGKPCEMVDAQHIDMDVMPVNLLFPAALLADSLKDLLGAKDLMAAAECLDFREHLIQCLYAQ